MKITNVITAALTAIVATATTATAGDLSFLNGNASWFQNNLVDLYENNGFYVYDDVYVQYILTGILDDTATLYIGANDTFFDPGSDSATEAALDRIVDWVNDGGRLVLAGEGTAYDSQNTSANNVLSALGLTATIGAPNTPGAYTDANPDQINSESFLMSGVDQLRYGYAASINNFTGDVLLRDEDLVETIIGYQQIGEGDLIVMSDGNIATPVDTHSGNQQFWLNIATEENPGPATVPTPSTSVPEPATAIALAFVAGLGYIVKRR